MFEGDSVETSDNGAPSVLKPRSEDLHQCEQKFLSNIDTFIFKINN